MGWKANALLVLFVLAVMAFALLGVMRTESSGSRLHMTPDEVSYVMKNLEKRSAADCVLTRTDYGFVCKEMATGRVFKVKVK
jgi:lipopolysaccharide export system protein LptC